MNPFEREFKHFSQNLTQKSDSHHVEAVTGKAGAVYQDKPFTVEYRNLYNVAQVAQGAAQVVTFASTAGLGAWALESVITAPWGIYVAVPLGILFAILIEAVKRSTLSIAAKHLLKYKTFGGVGVVALAVMLVSIGAALLGAKELPNVVFPAPKRLEVADRVKELNTDLERVQADINRASGKRLTRLQNQRTDLIGKRDAAAAKSSAQADSDYQAAITDRSAKIERMQTYSVGACIVAESVFLAAGLFILYFLWRAFAEQNQAATQAEPERRSAPITNPENVPGYTITTTPKYNGNAVKNRSANDAAVSVTIPAEPLHARADDFRTTIPTDTNTRTCLHCGTPYIYRHAKQKYCSDGCRLTAWEQANGKRLRGQYARSE